MINPFEKVGRPATGERLIGREEIVDDIYRALIAGANYSIAGLHRIGKTSIGKEVLSRIEKDNHNIRCASITMGTIHSELELYQDIADGLCFEKVYESSSNDNAWRDFKRYICKENSNSRAIVMLDELDSVSDLDNSGLIVNRLRELAHEDRYNLTFLFISARTLLWIQNKGNGCGSNLSGICHNSFIGPFKDATVLDKMIKRSGIESPQLSKLLFAITGGHPFLAELLLCATFNLAYRKNNELSCELLKEALSQNSNQFIEYYKRLEFFINDMETNAWSKLCDYTVGPLLELLLLL